MIGNAGLAWAPLRAGPPNPGRRQGTAWSRTPEGFSPYFTDEDAR
ncbi:hypothetical protein AHiyo8_pI67520 (plasmid) [Arthrobacter sp. Hiyo8]|nr:hypothetical protein AHiyo8_pI67520 [Arthrobacter sp. Hiyo8]